MIEIPVELRSYAVGGQVEMQAERRYERPFDYMLDLVALNAMNATARILFLNQLSIKSIALAVDPHGNIDVWSI